MQPKPAPCGLMKANPRPHNQFLRPNPLRRERRGFFFGAGRSLIFCCT